MDNRRRIIMINRKFQITLIIKFLLVNILILGFFGSFLFLFLNSEVEANLYSAHVTYQNMKDMLFPIVLTLSILNIIISSAIITIFVLYASFRIAGPLYRFNAAIKEIAGGNLRPLLKLRNKDELYEFSSSLQEMANSFIELVVQSRIISADLKKIAQETKNEELNKKIKEMDSLIEGIKT